MPQATALALAERIRAMQPELRNRGVRSLALFGSHARGEAGPDSDVDLLVDFMAPPTFDQYMGLRFLLEDRLGRRVDLVTRTGLRPGLLAAVERDAIHVA